MTMISFMDLKRGGTMDHSEECMEMIANAGEAKTLALNALSLAGQGAF